MSQANVRRTYLLRIQSVKMELVAVTMGKPYF